MWLCLFVGAWCFWVVVTNAFEAVFSWTAIESAMKRTVKMLETPDVGCVCGLRRPPREALRCRSRSQGWAGGLALQLRC